MYSYENIKLNQQKKIIFTKLLKRPKDTVHLFGLIIISKLYKATQY